MEEARLALFISAPLSSRHFPNFLLGRTRSESFTNNVTILLRGLPCRRPPLPLYLSGVKRSDGAGIQVFFRKSALEKFNESPEIE